MGSYFLNQSIRRMRKDERGTPSTNDVQVDQSREAAPVTDNKVVRLVASQGRSYHPRTARMTIALEKKPSERLVCHYAPSSFTETEVADWQEVAFRNGSIVPIQYKVTKPRRWQMQLLFNDIGDYQVKGGGAKSTEDSINWLMDVMRPNNARLATRDWGYDQAAVLLVFLTSSFFKCALTNMSIKRLAIHPLTRKTTRALVDATFTEYVLTPYEKK